MSRLNMIVVPQGNPGERRHGAAGPVVVRRSKGYALKEYTEEWRYRIVLSYQALVTS